jgi:mono/diheme cytochrome c family protein
MRAHAVVIPITTARLDHWRQTMRNILFVFVFLAVLGMAACGGGGSADAVVSIETVPPEFSGQTNPLGSDAATAGAQSFKFNCEPCHGPQGHGDGPAGQALDPKPRDLVELQGEVGDDYLFWRIATGKPGTSMVAWRGVLTDEQIWQVVTFLHTLK